METFLSRRTVPYFCGTEERPCSVLPGAPSRTDVYRFHGSLLVGRPRWPTEIPYGRGLTHVSQPTPLGRIDNNNNNNKTHFLFFKEKKHPPPKITPKKENKKRNSRCRRLLIKRVCSRCFRSICTTSHFISGTCRRHCQRCGQLSTRSVPKVTDRIDRNGIGHVRLESDFFFCHHSKLQNVVQRVHWVHAQFPLISSILD